MKSFFQSNNFMDSRFWGEKEKFRFTIDTSPAKWVKNERGFTFLWEIND